MHVGDDAHSHRAPLASLAESGRRTARSPLAAPRRRSDMLWRPFYLARCAEFAVHSVLSLKC